MNMDSKTPITDEQYELLGITSQHEAGHAVMRWITGIPLTALTANFGDGLCAGTDRQVCGHAVLRVTLAGPAAESGYNLAQVDVAKSQCVDFDEARQLLRDGPVWLRYVTVMDDGQWTVRTLSIAAALQHHFEKACADLRPYGELVDRLSERLMSERMLTARTVAAICREYGKRGLREQTTLA